MDLLNNEQIILGRDFSDRVVPLLDGAKSSIKIVVFDWRVYLDGSASLTNFNNAIFNAVKRGVEVKAVVNSKSILDTLKQNGVKAKHFTSKSILHAKFICIDDRTLILGSHNFSQNAFTTNLEVSLVCELDFPNSRLHSFFNNIYGL